MVSKNLVKIVLCIIVLIWEVQGGNGKGDGTKVDVIKGDVTKADGKKIKIIADPPANSPDYEKSALKASNAKKLRDLCHGKTSFQNPSSVSVSNIGLTEVVNKFNGIVDKYLKIYSGPYQEKYDKASFMKHLEDAKVLLSRIGVLYKTEVNSSTFQKRSDDVCDAIINVLQKMAKSTFKDYEKPMITAWKPYIYIPFFIATGTLGPVILISYYEHKVKSQEKKFENLKNRQKHPNIR